MEAASSKSKRSRTRTTPEAFTSTEKSHNEVDSRESRTQSRMSKGGPNKLSNLVQSLQLVKQICHSDLTPTVGFDVIIACNEDTL